MCCCHIKIAFNTGVSSVSATNVVAMCQRNALFFGLLSPSNTLERLAYKMAMIEEGAMLTIAGDLSICHTCHGAVYYCELANYSRVILIECKQ